MRIAITGGTGFIGRYIVKALLRDGHSINLLVHSKIPRATHENIRVIKGDLHNKAVLADLVQDVDVVIHCAGLTAAIDKDDFFKINTAGTKNIARITGQSGNKKFLLLSSLAAREPKLSSYAQSKFDAEQTLESISNLRWDALRPPAVYGPGDKHFLIVPKLLKHRLALRSSGKNVRVSLIHVQDLANAVATWVNQSEPSENIYEIDDGKNGGYSWDEIYGTVAPMVTDKKPFYISAPSFVMYMIAFFSSTWAKLTNKTAFLTKEKIREALHDDWVCHDREFIRKHNWQAEITLSKGMKETIASYKQSGDL